MGEIFLVFLLRADFVDLSLMRELDRDRDRVGYLLILGCWVRAGSGPWDIYPHREYEYFESSWTDKYYFLKYLPIICSVAFTSDFFLDGGVWWETLGGSWFCNALSEKVTFLGEFLQDSSLSFYDPVSFKPIHLEITLCVCDGGLSFDEESYEPFSDYQ